MEVSISHPTDRPNFSVVDVGPLRLWFSYSTVIAFKDGYSGPTARENDWGPTTGKHLNQVPSGAVKADRVPSSEFERCLQVVLQRLDISVSAI